MVLKNYAYFLQILNIASILDNYKTYFQNNKIIPIPQVF